MRHPDASLAAYVDGSASARERATAEAHLKTCAECRREVKRAKLARTALAGLPELEGPGLDAAAMVQTVTAARAARAAKRPAAATAPALEVVPTQEWAPQTAEAVEESAELEAESAVVEDLESARRRRARDRSRALRVAEAALGAAAVLVAIVLFIGLRNQPVAERSSSGGGTAESAASPAQDAAALDYTPVTLTAHAKDLAAQINTSGTFSSPSIPAGAPVLEAASEEGMSCIQRATGGLVKPSQLYQIQQAKYLGQPAWIGAFITDADTEAPTLLVIAVSTEGCTTNHVQQLIREPLQPPGSPASP